MASIAKVDVRGFCGPWKADVTNFPRLFSFAESFDDSAFSKVPFGIIIVYAFFVDLPQIKMICLGAPQRFIELPHGNGNAHCGVSINLRHQEYLVTKSLKRLSHPFLAFAVMVVPGVVEKVHARVDGLYASIAIFQRRRAAKAVAAQSDNRECLFGAPERLVGNPVRPRVA